ncbi:hypothetical protein MBLNU459_g4076t1 [Dothideomycetes sp. NU459]
MANKVWHVSDKHVIELADPSVPIPQPAQHQALVRIHAVALNFRDLLVSERSPAYPVVAKPDLIPCSDGAGVVEVAGSSSKWKKGDRVVLCANTWENGDQRNFNLTEVLGGGDVDGTLRRWAVLDDNHLVRAPKNLSMVEASTMYTAGVTACRALFFGPVVTDADTTILTQGTGGVSCYAIQLNIICKLAAAVGARVISTSSSDSKLISAGLLGAKHTINYTTTPSWSDEVLRITSGKGVDNVIEVSGADTIEQAIKATRFAGLVTVVGLLSESRPPATDLITAILYGAKTITGIIGAGSKEMLEYLVKLVEKYDIHPPIAQIFEFEEADKAFEYLKTPSEVGKVVIKC